MITLSVHPPKIRKKIRKLTIAAATTPAVSVLNRVIAQTYRFTKLFAIA
jgi:hypothetical protein